jgi:hypothetical protein
MEPETLIMIILNASEWFDIHNYIIVSHEHACVHCRDQEMHDALHKLQSELIAAGEEVEFQLQAGKDSHIK